MSGADPLPVVLMITALREERSRLVTALQHHGWARDTAFFLSRKGAPARVMTAATGDGLDVAGETLRKLLRAVRPSGVVACGVAGALVPGLDRDAIVEATSIVDESGRVAACALWPDRISRSIQRSPFVRGAILSVRRPLLAPAQKAEAAVRHRHEAPLAVDMESATWAGACADERAPMHLFRIILDDVTESLPASVAAGYRPDGSLSRARIAAYAIAHPRELRRLADLARRLRQAMTTLSDEVVTLLEQGLVAGDRANTYDPTG